MYILSTTAVGEDYTNGIVSLSRYKNEQIDQQQFGTIVTFVWFIRRFLDGVDVMIGRILLFP